MLNKIIDIIKNNLYPASNMEETSVEAVIAALLIATVCGAVIYCVYRFFYKGVVYSENFNLLIMLVCVVTAFIIKTISVNLVLSLGMVGALSIVRFRAAIKDPLDVGFLFWSVAAGLTAGAQLYGAALISTVFVAIIFVLMTFIRKEKRCYLLIVRFSPAAEAAINTELGKVKYKLKNKTKASDMVEITIEVNIKKNNTAIVDTFNGIQDVNSCVLLEYTGDYSN